MTMVDSDSASQDSDDGRRFRFEATRKDAFVSKDTTKERETSKNFRSKSSHCENDRYYRDRRERSKHESDKRINDKDFRQSSSKHSRHESRDAKQEYNKNSYKDHLSSRDTSVGSTATDRESRNSSGGDTRERSRNSKRHSDKDRSTYSTRHSKERSYDRNYHDGRTSSDKHRNRDYERYKHRSRDRSQSRVHQSNKVKSSSDDYRDGYGKHDSFQKRTSSKENKLQNSKEHLSLSSKNVKEAYNKNTKNDTVDNQEYKDLELSQFDVLSEIENMSDSRDSESRTSSSPRSRKRERHESDDRAESRVIKKRTKEIDDGASKRERQEESCKVKQRKYDQVSTSSNNPSAISDSSRAVASSATLSITREFLTNFEREKSEQAEKKMISHDDINEGLNVSSDETQQLGKCIGQTKSTYGPLLPPEFVFSNDKLETDTPGENKINDDSNSTTSFIGPRLPSLSNDCQNEEREDAVTSNMPESDAVFGPALPPHLLQRQRDKNSRDKIIGPVLFDVEKLQKETLVASWESDDDSAIGPLPADHPALRNSQVHEQLDLRAETIRREGYRETEVNKYMKT